MAENNHPNLLQQLFDAYVEQTIEKSIKNQHQTRIKELEIKIKNARRELDAKKEQIIEKKKHLMTESTPVTTYDDSNQKIKDPIMLQKPKSNETCGFLALKVENQNLCKIYRRNYAKTTQFLTFEKVSK